MIARPAYQQSCETYMPQEGQCVWEQGAWRPHRKLEKPVVSTASIAESPGMAAAKGADRSGDTL